MNKQQLAKKIWQSANKMRSKIEANEYKDYIIGFVFYKFLSDKEEQFLKANEFSDRDIADLTEEDTETVEFIKNGIGYFIAYPHLFSTWINKGSDFDISDVRDALSAFSRNIKHKKVFEGIFDTLQTGLSKLGENANSQSNAASSLIYLIKDIPMEGKQDYDVLGFIYEYLLGMFAANAGKKAGEFYTPHEVSLLMSEIMAYHLKDREKIEIYDPTSGSGSLLINIGQSVSRHIDDENNIKYYAQELKQNTYNLTRMNLIMRGVLPANIVTRNADTLEDDWPYFDESDPVNSYQPLYVDAVVSNPPYSQEWQPKNKESDPRYARFGLAPKGKADFAFLLHDLYHLKPDGIMTIVLPHGVLFRGGDEETIRKNLIEHNHIDAIIGLPANIFFGTGIPTIILVLKQKRSNTDVLIVDASKGFIKVGKDNQLRASDIKKITDAVINRENIDKYARVVSQKDIRGQNYNLNIPRYVDSSDDAQTWDIYATMFGGIPQHEIDHLQRYWQTYPSLRETLFTQIKDMPYYQLTTTDIEQRIYQNQDVKAFFEHYRASFSDFSNYLYQQLIDHATTLKISKQENLLANDIFMRLQGFGLIDKYTAYQSLDDLWQSTMIDLEIIQTEGFSATKKVMPNMVTKKVKGKEEEVQEGWVGHILPFDLVQQHLLADELQQLQDKESRLSVVSGELDALMNELDEEQKENLLNDSGSSFSVSDVNKALDTAYADIETPEITALNDYLDFLESSPKKPAKLDYVASELNVNWGNIEANKGGDYSKTKVKAYIKTLQATHEFVEDSDEATLVQISDLLEEEKTLKSEIKEDTEALHQKTKETIEALDDATVNDLLNHKWIVPLYEAMMQLADDVVSDLTRQTQALADKYADTYIETTKQLAAAEDNLANMIDQLTGDTFDMAGLKALQTLLKG
ncbi:type I restriction-modification system subunit M [Psychrobacter sp. Ps1]|uniref:type I restriction-modification system subunit M n=1 Tax=Psychrobacter sp. Ps1 TaxID=2790955 RepID=UPI001EDDF996|nr:type I restriction-modification system subunit M [Psychrobacter sp. Ps1]MCG3841913.1 type I restriction-modification system subunit M [Psychrobacter sp. Ps1]